MSNTIWQPQPRQQEFMMRAEDEALYGGAAGGGKSDALVIEATRQVHIPHYKGLILRKTYPQLTELIEKSLRYYSVAFPDARYNASDHSWRFKSGAKIIFGSMQHSKDKLNYQGKAYDFIAFDELTHFTYDEYIYLLSRNRPNGAGTRCYMRATANPGGIGHGWVKERFITAANPMETIWDKTSVTLPTGEIQTEYRSRVFVPSSVFDNKALLDNDPNYLSKLAMLPEAEKKALLYGDWDSYSGQFFTEWRNDPTHYIDRRWTHVIEPFEIPSHWKVYRSFDFGYNAPFSVGYWTVDSDGVIYRICEWYGSPNSSNVGLKLPPHELFRQMSELEHEHPYLKGKIITGVADPSIWDTSRGESIADVAARYGIYFSPGDNARLSGWSQCHYRLHFDTNGLPMMYVFKNCKDFIRTIPNLIFDDKRVEDVKTDGVEDHQADEFRYFAMSRPIAARENIPPDPYYTSPSYTVLDIPKSMVTASRTPTPPIIIKEIEE